MPPARGIPVDLEVVAIKGLLLLTLLACGWMMPALAGVREPGDQHTRAGHGGADSAREPAPSPASAPPAPTDSSVAGASPDSPGEARYAALSNEALTALAAQWDTLDRHERRALLTEVRQRMAQRGAPGTGVIQIRTERRYGRMISPDGRVIRIQTQVVRVRPATESEAFAGRSGGFGVGFERRSGAGLAAGGQPPPENASSAGSAQRASLGQLPAPLPSGQPIAPTAADSASPR